MRRREWISCLVLGALALVGTPVMAKRGGSRRAAAARWQAPPATPEDFEVSLAQVGTASVEGGVVLELTVRNRADGPRTFCAFGTPFEGLIGDVIEITDDKGARVDAYQGPLVSRPPPRPDAYHTLRAGESRSVRFGLLGSYALKPGAYRVRTGSGLDSLPRPAPLALRIAAQGSRAAPPEERLEVTLTPEPGASVSRGVFVTLVVRNLGTKPRRFCEYHTPFEGMRNHFIELLDPNGAALPYQGMMADRVAPTEADFFTLQPGHSRGQRFDLRKGFAPRPGHHRVRFLGGAASELPDSPAVPIEIGP